MDQMGDHKKNKRNTNFDNSNDYFKLNVHNASAIFRFEFDQSKIKKKKKNEEIKIETFDYGLKSGYITQKLRNLTHIPSLQSGIFYDRGVFLELGDFDKQ